jgi:hypothetical protein
MSFFIYRRASTRELFALHEEQGRNVLIPGDTQDNPYKTASTTPGFLGFRDNGGPGITDGGIHYWMTFFAVPPEQWPAGT